MSAIKNKTFYFLSDNANNGKDIGKLDQSYIVIKNVKSHRPSGGKCIF